PLRLHTPCYALFPYTTLFRSRRHFGVQLVSLCTHANGDIGIPAILEHSMAKILRDAAGIEGVFRVSVRLEALELVMNEFESNVSDRKSTRLNSSHVKISYAVF